MNKLLSAVLFGVSMLGSFPNIVFSEVPQTPKEAIQSELGGLPVMMRIARAESNFDPKAKNAHSSASGLFQILHSTWVSNKCTGDVFNPTDNVLCAARLYEKNGTNPWLASKDHWQ